MPITTDMTIRLRWTIMSPCYATTLTKFPILFRFLSTVSQGQVLSLELVFTSCSPRHRPSFTEWTVDHNQHRHHETTVEQSIEHWTQLSVCLSLSLSLSFSLSLSLSLSLLGSDSLSCYSSLYLDNYELDFNETWRKCWNLGPIDLSVISKNVKIIQ